MANIEHVNITDPNIHEPKGVSTATTNEVYVADGAGSGSWKTVYTQGFEDYADNASGAQPLTSGSWVDLTNDGAGASSLTTYRLPGFSAIWDVSNNQFDWDAAGLSLGDTVDIRFDVTFNINTSNDEVALRMDLAHGDAAEYSIEVYRNQFKSTGNHRVTALTSIYMGNLVTLNNPAKLAGFSDSTSDTCTVHGFYVRVIPRSPVFN